MVLLPHASYAQAEFFRVRVENVAESYEFLHSGAFTTPVGAQDPAPIGPGEAYEFEFDAVPGARLTLATMFVQSNDLFYATAEEGIPLWNDDGMQISGDVTSYLELWDAGTEVNQEPGEGPDQAPRQSGPDTGEDENEVVRLVDDTYDYPATGEVIRVTLTPDMETSFHVLIENVSTSSTLNTSMGAMLPVPLSPGVWVVHTAPAPLFTDGEPDREEGLEAIAEDGDPAELAETLAARTGVVQILSPGVWAVHTDPAPLFEVDAADYGMGLGDVAEDGDPSVLSMSLAAEPVVTGGAFAVPSGAEEAGPILPGGHYEFTVVAKPDTRFSLATMFVQSNDLFYAPGEEGIRLWNDSGNAISGDVTSEFMLWDAGTEVNEKPGFGLNQAPRQSGPNTGADDDDVVHMVDDGYTYPAVDEVIRVTVEPLEAVPFRVRVLNVSTDATLETSTGESVEVPLSPGVWVVHSSNAPLFSVGSMDRGFGLEAIAEDGDPAALDEALAMKAGVSDGAFTTPVDSSEPSPAGPGSMYEFMIDAAPGTRLSLATMFVQSNDLFYAPDEGGVPLWDGDGQPVSGDITDYFDLWDAGTEENQEPGVGPDQAPRQSGPNIGADEDGAVRLVDDAYTYPEDADVIELTIVPLATASEPETELPSAITLYQNYPNPFNPSTQISFALPEAGAVTLRVYDVLGRQVAELFDGQLPPGLHDFTWNARDASGAGVASGTYIYRLWSQNKVVSRTMVLLR
jgi:hypothetical protein